MTEPCAYNDDDTSGTIDECNRMAKYSVNEEAHEGFENKRAKLEEEEVTLASCLNRDAKKLSVKELRRLVPELRIKCFFREEEIYGKRKLKRLWDTRPPQWPSHVPFFDPNNPSKDASKKPIKNELVPMFEYLRQLFIHKVVSGEVSLPKVSPPQPHQPQQPPQPHQPQQPPQPHQPQLLQQQPPQPQLPQPPAFIFKKSPTDTLLKEPFHPSLPHNNHNSSQHHTPQPHPTRLHTPPHHPPNHPSHHPPNHPSHHPPNHHPFHHPQNNQPHHPSNFHHHPPPPHHPPAPQIVISLMKRINSKIKEVEDLQNNNKQQQQHKQQQLHELHNNISNIFHDTTTPDQLSACLTFVDMGHQMEAMLDSLLLCGGLQSDLFVPSYLELNRKCVQELKKNSCNQ